MENTSSSIQTYSGILIDLKNPNIEDILVPDIAHQLANTCRYTGACRKFYSVAQHCILASKLVEGSDHSSAELKLQVLLHDATEAYLGDVSTPLKTLLPDYRAIEDKFQKVIIKRFGLQIPDFAHIKFYDRLALDIESKALMGPRHSVWDKYKVDFPIDYELDYSLLSIAPMTADEAETEYLKTFNELWLSR